MAVKLINREWNEHINSYQHEYICDTEDDVATLPTCCSSSSALVVSTGNVYVVNASGEWVAFGGE